MKLYLIRHGQTDWNIQGKIQGSHDIPLNETGREQARQVAKGMESKLITRIFSSTLKRARETAEEIAKIQNVDICYKKELIEVEFGKWEGLTWEEIKKAFPNEYQRWSSNPVEVAPTGGETQDQVIWRTMEVVEEILKVTNGREDVAIVSHGLTIAYLIAYMMRNHPEEAEIIVENASITTIHYDPVTKDFALLEVNQTSHYQEKM